MRDASMGWRSRARRALRYGAPVVLALACLWRPAAPSARQTGPATAQVTGVTFAADTELPLRRVRVAPTFTAGLVQPVLTDDEGRFTLTVPASAPFTITATKAGYAATLLPVARPSTQALSIAMSRGGVISGGVADSRGVLAAGTVVVARRIDAGAGNDPSAYFSATTDDVGEYRIGGLPAGRYVVGAGSANPTITRVVRPAVLDPIERAIPGTETAPRAVAIGARVDAEARAPVELGAGDEVRGVAIVVPAVESSVDLRKYTLARLNEIAIAHGRQPPPDPPCAGTGALHGRVMTSTGQPLAGVAVRIDEERPLMAETSITDGTGTYSFECVRPGDYVFDASRRAYIRSGVLPPRIRIGEDETVSGPTVVFQRSGAFTGVVLDEHGEPVEGVRVRALQLQYAQGRITAVVAGTGMRTDDRGHFRIFDLERGSYVIEASIDASLAADDGDTFDYAPLYYPGTSSIDAAVQVRAEPGAEVTGLDVVLRPTTAARIAGIALDSGGQPLVGSVLVAVGQRSGGVAKEPLVQDVGADGAFAIPNVPPGEYVVQAARTPGPGRAPEFGSEYVTVVDRHPLPLVIRTSPGATLEGKLTVERGGPDGGRSHQFSLMAYPADPDRAPFTGRGTGLVINSTGDFYGVGLYGPRQIVLATAPPHWYLKSVAVDGIDVTDSGIDLPETGTVAGAEIVISTRGGSIAGRAVDERGDPVAGSVVVLAVDRTRWTPYSRYLKSARTDLEGTFTIRGLPPGEYWVAAVETLETGAAGDAWQHPAMLDALASGAERVTLGESDSQRVVIPMRR